MCGNCDTLSSDNFIVRWGSGVSQSQAQTILDSFEFAWSIEVGQMDYEPPTSTETYLFNVYIGDSGGSSPDGYGAAGYFTGDNQGYPMIVIAKQTLEDEYYMHSTIAHEFFHAVQGRTGRYDYDAYGPGAWYWEATANWVEGEVYPDDVSGMAYFLVGYTYFPHYPVNFFDYPDEGTLQEYHQYGAFIFPRHLTEVEADVEVIRSSWQDTSSDSDPLNVLNSYLPSGLSIQQAWLNHIARMTVMDYQNGEAYEEYLAYYSGYPESQNRYADTVTRDGSNGWQSAPNGTVPQRFGHNTIIARSLNAEAVEFGVKGDGNGSEGSAATHGATVTRDRGGSYSYYPLEFSGNTGSVVISDVRSSDEYYLSIGVWTDSWDPNRVYSETFDYQYYIGPSGGVVNEPSGEPSNEPSSNPDDDGRNNLEPGFYEDDLKAGCSQVGVSDLGVFGLLISGLLVGRRRF